MKKITFFIIFWYLLSSCNSGYYKHIKDYTFKSTSVQPDYSNLNYWAAHPFKKNTSDSVAKPLRNDYVKDSSVDIFFIHPTTYTNKEKQFGWNAPIDNDTLNAKTDYTTILFQASVFNAAGRIFAPRYRQAHLSAYYPQTKNDTLNATRAFDTAYNDIKIAFEYYLQHWNNGRPIIIASHSQGTTHAKRLLKEYFEGKPLQQKLVVAYIVGMVIEPNYFSKIKPCEKPNQTGCFCGWRTFQENYIPLFVKKEKFISVVTNPISWDIDKPQILRAENKGSILLNFNKYYFKVADAKIEQGVLWTRKPHFVGNVFYKSKNFHIADYNLYYYNIRENVEERKKAYFLK